MRLNNTFSRILFFVIAAGTASVISFGQKSTSVNTDRNTISFSELKFIDIGMKTKPGSQTINKNEIKIEAGGADIWGKHDEFRFGYKEISGDFDLIIQILSLSAANKYTKAGIMAREDLSDSSKHVYYQVFPDNSARNKNNGGCEFQYRSINGADMKAIYPDPQTAGIQFNVNFPNTYIRLKRSGDFFESYFSNDNKTWKLYTSFTLKLAEKLFVGPAITSHNKTDRTTAEFASFQHKK
jgi:hypothetical protein